jgi:hypothetical protein
MILWRPQSPKSDGVERARLAEQNDRSSAN